jgi:hypothetical protein
MAISANSSQLGTNNSWLNTIITPEINQQLKQSLTNKELSFNETKEIFLTIAKDGLSYEEQADLNTIWSQNKVIFGDDYTRSITNYIINGNAANTIWWGWLNSDSNKLGNLSTESSEIDIKRLIDKWFSGKDVPLPYVGGDSAAGISGDYKYDYDTVITDTLFDNGVRYSQIWCIGNFD